MRLLWTCCLCLFAVQGAMALTVSTTVDRENVRRGESVVVIYAADEQVTEPDFTPIEEDFEILDRGQSRSITISGGQANVENAWRLVLRPRQSGELSLPRIQFGDRLSDPRTITVAEAPAGDDRSGHVRIEYSVDDRMPYVSQQVVLTVTVRAPSTVADMIVSTPEIVEGAGQIDKLGSARQYETVQDSRRFEVHEQRYTLVPGAAGRLRLSPIEVQGRIDETIVRERSAPLELDVLRATASGQRDEVAPDDLFLEVEVDKQSPYVQEQVLYTVRVLRAVAIENASLSMPAVSGGDAVIERIGSDRRYQASRDGRRYAVTDRRFAVFPQTSGKLTIDPVRLSASVPLPSASGSTTGFWNQPLTRAMQIESEPRELSVKAPPAAAPSPWLPARRVTLEEDWPDRNTVEVGTPVTRRIILSAEALMASQLPDLDVPLPVHVRSYPERPLRETTSGERGLSGRLEQAMALIPSQAGTLTVPALELEWWNTGTDRKETLRLPAHTLEVAARPAMPSPDGGQAIAPDVAAGGAEQPSRTAWWLGLGLGSAWLATLVLWWWDRRRVASAASGKPDRAGDASRRRVEARLRAACRNGDPRAARDAMLDWGRVCWPDRPPRSLGSLGETTNDAVAAELAALQHALYAPGAGAWQGDALHRAVVSFDPDRNRARHDTYTLKPLYEH